MKALIIIYCERCGFLIDELSIELEDLDDGVAKRMKDILLNHLQKCDYCSNKCAKRG